MITFVPSFVSARVREWQLGVQDAAAQAGVDDRDLEAMARFTESYPLAQPRATLADVVAHLEHAREVAGVDHVGLGGDFDGVRTLPDGLEDVSAYPRLFEALAERGWGERDLLKLAHGNICRVFAAVEEVSIGLRRTARPSNARIEIDRLDDDRLTDDHLQVAR